MWCIFCYSRAVPDINQGVERANKEEQGAGDQGMMFGYATNETESYMPLAIGTFTSIIERIGGTQKGK